MKEVQGKGEGSARERCGKCKGKVKKVQRKGVGSARER